MPSAFIAAAAGAVTLFVTPDCPSQDNPPACTAATLSVVGSSFLTTLLDHPVPAPLQVQVLDAQQRPVPGVTVHFTRLDRPEDVSTPDEPAPDATLSSDRAVTDNSGRAQVTAAANNVAGSYQYVATVMRGPETLKAYFVLANRPRMDGVSLTPVVEYVNSNDGHYFITADAGEMWKLDSGVLTGWARTGNVFSAPLPGPNELLPDPVSGECPTGSSPLFSAYNNRDDGNHRYSPSIAVIHALVFDGWIAEGYGPNAVAACFPE